MNNERRLCASDLNSMFLGEPVTFEIAARTYHVRVEGIMRDNSLVRLFVGVPAGQKDETYLDLDINDTVFHTPNID